uniref:Tesmin/TSO1-like CXC domain-containing protein n=1 Tax=Clytia hemisphaerica TaxID=252671 RepID=A0A7M5X6V4_9CNID
YVLTGCDTVSMFAGRGKKTAWNTWNSLKKATKTFVRLSDSLDLEEEDFEIIQRFVVTLYDRTNPCTDVNECRRMLFTKKQRPVESLPPTQDALRLHVHRTMNESSKFCNATERTMPLRNVLEWGYKKNERGMTVPRWMNQPEASKACQELIKCGCKKMCGARCKCKKAGLSCTELCQCGGC